MFYGYYVVGAIMGIHWYLSTTFVYGFQALFLPIVNDFGWSRGVASIAASIRNVENGVAGPLVGYLVDRYGSRVMATSGVITMGAGMIALGFIQNLLTYYLAFLIISVGFSSIIGVPFQSLVVNWFQRLRGRMLGISMSGAVASGPFVIGMVWLVNQYGWRQTAVICGIGMWLIGIPLAWGVIRSKPTDKGLLPDGDLPGTARAETSRRAAAAGPQVRAFDAMRNVNFWLIALIFGVLTMDISAMFLHQIPYFESVGYTRVEAATSVGYFTVLSLFGRIVGGWLMERFDGRFIIAGVLTSEVIALGVMLKADPSAYWALLIFGLFFGTAFGGMVPARPYMITSLFGLRAFGKIQGLLTFSSMPFGILAPWLLGYFSDRQGDYQMGVQGLVVVTALAIPFCFLLRLPPRPAP